MAKGALLDHFEPLTKRRARQAQLLPSVARFGRQSKKQSTFTNLLGLKPGLQSRHILMVLAPGPLKNRWLRLLQLHGSGSDLTKSTHFVL